MFLCSLITAQDESYGEEADKVGQLPTVALCGGE